MILIKCLKCNTTLKLTSDCTYKKCECENITSIEKKDNSIHITGIDLNLIKIIKIEADDNKKDIDINFNISFLEFSRFIENLKNHYNLNKNITTAFNEVLSLSTDSKALNLNIDKYFSQALELLLINIFGEYLYLIILDYCHNNKTKYKETLIDSNKKLFDFICLYKGKKNG